MMPPNTLRLEHVSCAFGGQSVLWDIHCTLDSARPLVGLIGPNGCGKTTLLRAVCGRLKHGGQCLWNNSPLEDMQVQQLSKTVSYIPQRTGVQISLPVLDVVLLGFHADLRFWQKPDAAMHKAAREALQALGIAHLEMRDYLTLSEGEKQLCILARTLVERTPLLLLDEPDSALDFHKRYDMMRILRGLTRHDGRMAVVALHDPTLALTFCDRLVLLGDGRVQAVLCPQTDPRETMERAFAGLFPGARMCEVMDDNQRRFVLLPGPPV